MNQKYAFGCRGCEISKDDSQGVRERGGIIELEGYWTLNHYGGPEGFLGWLILQPQFHRMDISDLTSEEACALGKNIQTIDNLLRQYWSIRFPQDPIQRVYVVYFHETVFGTKELEEPSQDWHLHIHLIPRTKTLGTLLRRKEISNNGSIRAWSMPDIVQLSRSDFPSEYIKTNENMRDLMKNMRELI